MPNYLTYPQALELFQEVDNAKQNTLTAGSGIEIENDVIRATGGGGGTSDYEDLTNKPQINSVELVGEVSLSDLGVPNVNDDTEAGIADADSFFFYDASASGNKKSLWSNIKSVLKTYFDTIYNGKLTFDNTPTASSNNPVKSQGIKTYADTSQSGALSDIKSTVGWDGKNDFDYDLNSLKAGNTSGSWSNNVYTIKDVGYTVNSNNEISASGTQDGTGDGADFILLGANVNGKRPRISDYNLEGKKIDIGMNADTNKMVIAVWYFNSSGTYLSGQTIANGSRELVLSVPENAVYFLPYIRVKKSQTVSGMTFKPMLMDSNIKDTTYEPYHKSVEDTISDVYGIMGENGARNYITPDFTIKSLSAASDYGVAYSASQGIITLNGTATASNTILFHYRSGLSGEKSPIILPKGKYRIGKNDTNVSYEVVKTVNGSKSVIVTLGKNAKSVDFELTEETQIGLGLIFENGQVFDNFVTTPYLCRASDTYNDFTPYAMTNRELTVVRTGTITDIPGTVESDTYIKKQGNVVDVWIRSNGVTISANDYIGTLPSGFRPSADIIVTIFGTSSNKIVRGWVNSTNGKITCTEALTNDNIRCQFSFIA